jgi:hypothetical protein
MVALAVVWFVIGFFGGSFAQKKFYTGRLMRVLSRCSKSTSTEFTLTVSRMNREEDF